MNVSAVMNMPVEVVTAYLCRQSFAHFAKEFWSEVPGAGERPVWNWHMDVLCDEIQRAAERVFRGVPKEYDLVCNISPGTSKSTLFSILFPDWTWIRMPSCRHLSATHTDMLALDLAAKSRTVVKSEKYRACFPEVVLRGDQDTKSYYANTAGGDRLTCTVGGKSPMGFHAHFITVDDPIDPKKVMSELELKTAKEFMTQVIPTRKVDKAVSVTFLVMQRLHEEDPAGVMLGSHDEEGGRRVRHICLPAELAENVSPPELKSYYVGGLMDPVRLGAPVLAEYKKTLSAYAYAGQFQQCLVAGTLVTTGRGPVPIERVSVGDTVLTRHGWRDVLWSGRTGATSRLSSALFSDGSVVTGTGNHPVWCEGVGWVPLDALSGGMYNVSLCQDPEAKTLRSFSSTAGITSGAGGAGTSRTPTDSTSTVPCGFTTRVLSPLATTSITRTATRLTIELRIWSASLSASTACDTPTVRRSVVVFLMRSARLLSRGIRAKRVKRVIARAVGRLSGNCGTAPPTVITFAIPAGDRSDPVRSAAGRCTALPLVKTESGCGLMTRSAPTAADRSRPRTIAFPPAPAPVRPGGGVPAVAVYDITVDGAPEFFANGVLVHNSPVPLGGGMFKDYYFNQRVKAAPYQAKRIRYWDRACLVAGTMIQTSQGPKPIERVEVGELVLTRNGYRPVTFSGETKRVRSVLSVLFHSGSIVTGTPDHLVWTENRGWVPLAGLTKDDTSLCCHETGMSWDERSPVAWPVGSVPRTFDEDVPVYDLTVDGEHEFFANGILVHNSTEDGGCYTAGVLMAKDSDGNYYVEHCTWGQWEPYERNQRMLATAIRDRGRYGPRNEPVIHVEAEGGSSGKDAFKGVVKALAGFYVKEDRVTGDKVTRANPWSAQLAAKNVYFVDDGSWDLDAYVREHCSFPLGKYKDQVDASSGAFNLLTGMRADVSIQCVQIRPKGPRDGLRLVIATPENLKTVVVEEKTLLVRFRGLLDADEPLAHGIVNLLDTLDLRFEPIHPPDHQETWDEPIPPLNLPAADLMMSWDHGKKLWAFLLKKRDPPASAVVFVCDKDRAEAACYAVCDKLRPRLLKTPRPQIYRVGQGSDERHEGEAVNRHVYDTVRACRNLVVA